MDTIFKKGDRVFDIEYGWGSVIEVQILNRCAIKVLFDAKCQHTYLFDGQYPSEGGYPRKVLSFTEYTLEGFSQERPEELPNKGDIVWVRNEFPSEWEIGYFFKKEGNTYYISGSKGSQGRRSAGLEMTTTDPYEK